MRKYFSAIISNLVYFGINSIFFIIITPLAIKVMGNELYGLWTIILAISLFANIGTLNMTWVINKLASEKIPENENPIKYPQKIITSAFVILIPMAVLCTSIIILQRYQITALIKIDEIWKQQFADALTYIALSLLPQFLSISFQGFLLANILNRLVRKIDTIINICLWGGIIFLAYFEKNLVFTSLWYLFIQILNFLVYTIIVNRRFSLLVLFDKALIKRTFSLALYLVMQTLAISSFQQFDRIIIGKNLGVVDAGVYGIGTSIALRIVMVALQMASIMLPLSSLISTTGSRNELYTIFRKFTKISNLFISLIGCLLIIWIDLILKVWISVDFSKSYSLEFRILILAYIFWSISQPAHQLLIGAGNIRFTTFLYLATTALYLFFVDFGSRNFGLLGATAANLTVILLLGFNVFVYFKIPEKNNLRHMVQDNIFWIMIPIVFFCITLFTESTLIKIIFTLMIFMICGAQVINDKIFKKEYLSFTQREEELI
jgi:O-antigen/teichoic acid export membrane protein